MSNSKITIFDIDELEINVIRKEEELRIIKAQLLEARILAKKYRVKLSVKIPVETVELINKMADIWNEDLNTVILEMLNDYLDNINWETIEEDRNSQSEAKKEL